MQPCCVRILKWRLVFIPSLYCGDKRPKKGLISSWPEKSGSEANDRNEIAGFKSSRFCFSPLPSSSFSTSFAQFVSFTWLENVEVKNIFWRLKIENCKWIFDVLKKKKNRKNQKYLIKFKKLKKFLGQKEVRLIV